MRALSQREALVGPLSYEVAPRTYAQSRPKRPSDPAALAHDGRDYLQQQRPAQPRTSSNSNAGAGGGNIGAAAGYGSGAGLNAALAAALGVGDSWESHPTLHSRGAHGEYTDYSDQTYKGGGGGGGRVPSQKELWEQHEREKSEREQYYARLYQQRQQQQQPQQPQQHQRQSPAKQHLQPLPQQQQPRQTQQPKPEQLPQPHEAKTPLSQSQTPLPTSSSQDFAPSALSKEPSLSFTATSLSSLKLQPIPLDTVDSCNDSWGAHSTATSIRTAVSGDGANLNSTASSSTATAAGPGLGLGLSLSRVDTGADSSTQSHPLGHPSGHGAAPARQYWPPQWLLAPEPAAPAQAPTANSSSLTTKAAKKPPLGSIGTRLATAGDTHASTTVFASAPTIAPATASVLVMLPNGSRVVRRFPLALPCCALYRWAQLEARRAAAAARAKREALRTARNPFLPETHALQPAVMARSRAATPPSHILQYQSQSHRHATSPTGASAAAQSSQTQYLDRSYLDLSEEPAPFLLWTRVAPRKQIPAPVAVAAAADGVGGEGECFCCDVAMSGDASGATAGACPAGHSTIG